MEQVVVAVILLAIGYLFMDEFKGLAPTFDHNRRLCDYRCPGSTFEPVSGALARGIRLIEVHVYSDAQDRPVVALLDELHLLLCLRKWTKELLV